MTFLTGVAVAVITKGTDDGTIIVRLAPSHIHLVHIIALHDGKVTISRIAYHRCIDTLPFSPILDRH